MPSGRSCFCERPVILLDNVTKSFAARAVLSGVSLEVPDGRNTVIIGSSGAGKSVTLKLEADSLFLVADSASFDSTTNHWVKAHQDSVRGWRITHRGSPITAWVDKAGRLIAASEPGGITMVRTAFEIAFANWKLDETARAAPPKKPVR